MGVKLGPHIEGGIQAEGVSGLSGIFGYEVNCSAQLASKKECVTVSKK